MAMGALVSTSDGRLAWPSRSAEATEESASVHSRDRWWTFSGIVCFLASTATAFTIRMVGEMPAGEIVLTMAAGWALLCLVLNHAAPGELVAARFFRALLIAQLVAFVAYVASDIYRGSAPRDMARGWARMVFLAIDVVAVAYLFGCSRRNLFWFLIGQAAGALIHTAVLGPMFGDLWKFGLGLPITYALFFVVPWAGAFVTSLVAIGLGVVHFSLDYRSLGGICVLTGVLSLLQRISPRARWWIAPAAIAAAAASVFIVYEQTHRRGRATRSDIERTAMVTAAQEAFVHSPLVGHGSWFSSSDVYDNFVLIRHEAAKRERVGGFAGANTTPGDEALHSQILVALAEGGLFGGAFFIVFGAGLLWALCDTVLLQPWRRESPLVILVLLLAWWNLLFSPFSGAHRVYIAMACGLILMLMREKREMTASLPLADDNERADPR